MNVGLLSEISAVKARLDRFADELYVARRTKGELQRTVKAAEQQTEECELEIAAIVATDVTSEDGEKFKLKYSNDALRKAETARRLSKDPVYQDFVRLREKANVEAFNAGLDVQRLEDEERAVRGHLEAIGHEVNLLIHGK